MRNITIASGRREEEDDGMTTFRYSIQIEPLSGGLVYRDGTREAETVEQVRAWLDLVGRANRWHISYATVTAV